MAKNYLKAVKDNEEEQRRRPWDNALFVAGALGLGAVGWAKYCERRYQHERTEKFLYCETAFVPAEELIDDLEEGDLIEFLRDVYQHWAVYIGDGLVIHLQNSGLITCAELIEVDETRACRINLLRRKAYELGLQPRGSRQEIVEYALSRLDSRVKYHIARYNCEHFATECFYGEAFSDQADTLDGNITAKTLARIGAWIYPYE